MSHPQDPKNQDPRHDQDTDQEMEQLLRSVETPPPPPRLLESLKAEIPQDFSFPAKEEPVPENVVVFPSRRLRTWLAAASVVLMLGAGTLLVRQNPVYQGQDENLSPAVEATEAWTEAKKNFEDSAASTDGVAPEGGSAKDLRALGYVEEAKEAPVFYSPDPAPESAKPSSPSAPAPSDAALGKLVSKAKKEVRSRQNRAELTDGSATARIAPPPPVSPSRRPPTAELQRRVPAAEMPMVEAEVAVGASSFVTPSTGGDAEPNDAPYGDVFFEGYGTNPFIDTEDDRLSTFGLDVDTASYTVTRRYLRDGHLPPGDAVRIEEIVNYFDYGDRPPEEGDFAIHAEGAPSIFAEGERYQLLRFNLHGREIDPSRRKPASLTFVVDVSGSMNQENRLGLVKKALGLLLDELRPDDRVALVIYGSQARTIIEPTGDREALRRAIDALAPGGSTNAEHGLRLGYELAARQLRTGFDDRSDEGRIQIFPPNSDRLHRVILCSDGVANVGRTGADSIWDVIKGYAEQGIELTTVGFGMGNYNDVLMEQLADGGDGRYAYVDNLDEARRIFVEDLTGTLQTIAAEARVQVEFNPETVARYRLVGYENRDIADERFRDDTVDAGEIGAGHTVTALYEVKLHRELKKRDRVATLHLRWRSTESGEMRETSREVSGRDFAKSWEAASPALRLTTLTAEFGEILKGTYWAREGSLDEVFRRAQQVQTHFAGDPEIAEWVGLVGRAAQRKR